MEMISCPNCQKLTGYKRVIGFGTFFAVLLTAGFWLLALPFYPKRCITCGLTKTESVKWYRTWRVVGLPVLLIAVLAVLIDRVQQDPSHQAAPIFKGPDYNEVPSPNTIPVEGRSHAVPVSLADNVISVDSTSLLAAYQADERAANARYKNKSVAVTGVLSGVFIPSIDVSLRMAGKGLAATAFVTMGGPQPHSAEETFFLPGIQAHSGTSSFFGQQDTAAVANKLG